MTNAYPMLKYLEETHLGFDWLFNNLRGEAPHPARYQHPPHDITKYTNSDDSESWVIDIITAGYLPENLSVEFNDDKHILTVSGDNCKEKDSNQNVTQIHRGISLKNFQKVFHLGPSAKVDSVHLNNGILSITVVSLPKKQTVKTIPIIQTTPQLEQTKSEKSSLMAMDGLFNSINI